MSNPVTNTARLRELSRAVTQGREGWREFSMRVPAEPDRDADLVLSTAADEIESLRAAADWMERVPHDPYCLALCGDTVKWPEDCDCLLSEQAP